MTQLRAGPQKSRPLSETFSLTFFLKTLVFLEQFKFPGELSGRYRGVSYTPAPTHAQPAPSSTPCTRAVRFLQLMNLH